MNRRSKPETQKELEEQIGRALCSRAESIQVTSADTERMRRSVHRKIEEESGMKKWNMKRVFVVAAAICVLGAITAVAAGKVAYTSGGGSHLDDFTYDKLGEMETKLGYTTNAPEVFSNGYRFDMGMPTHQDAMDQDGNVIKSAESFSLHYKKTEARIYSLQSRAQACLRRKDSRTRYLNIMGLLLTTPGTSTVLFPRIIRPPMRRRQRKQQENSISLMEAIR